jgi:hypothetical protein
VSGDRKKSLQRCGDLPGAQYGLENPSPSALLLHSPAWVVRLFAYYDRNTDRTFDAKNRNAGAGDQRGKFIPHDE